MGKTILLADDSLTIQKVVELTLSGTEYELACVSNGQKALESLARSLPDLILADAVMPEKNGYEVCEAVKGNRATARIPVVLLSGIFEPFDRDRAERIGCDLVVSKPFDAQQLLEQIEGLLARAAAAPPPEDEEPPFETPRAEEPAPAPSFEPAEPGPFGAAAGTDETPAEKLSAQEGRPTVEVMRFESFSADAEPEEPMPPLPQAPPEAFGADGSMDLVIDDISAEDADALFEGSLAPVEQASVEPVPTPAPPAGLVASAAPIAVALTDEQIERIATRVVEKLSDRIVREIAWEVVPDMAEIAVKRRIAELESGTE
ncbi:MAG TPA: response regulator [Thermoanaerobaculia bacterium]|jgi:CheY-like chemotaxis protein|nr:response regulator [Thermoanaerobaculia bacterium]